MNVRQIACVAVSGIDGVAQVNADNFARAPFGNCARVTAFSAAAFDDCFTAHEIGRNRRNPVEELLFVMLLDPVELQPLRAEVFGGFALQIIAPRVGKAWNTIENREAGMTLRSIQLPRNDLRALMLGDIQRKSIAACRTNNAFQERFFHLPGILFASLEQRQSIALSHDDSDRAPTTRSKGTAKVVTTNLKARLKSSL